MFTEVLEKKFENIDVVFQLIYLQDSIIIFIVDEKLEFTNLYSTIQTKYVILKKKKKAIVFFRLDFFSKTGENCFIFIYRIFN